MLFLIIFCKKRYKKTIWKFGKLSRLISHFMNLGISIQWIITMPVIWYLLVWNLNDSLVSNPLPSFFSWYIHEPLSLFCFCFGLLWMINAFLGIVINFKKVKQRNLWYLFTKTDMQTIEESKDRYSLI
jgi:hypothetical protein